MTSNTNDTEKEIIPVTKEDDPVERSFLEASVVDDAPDNVTVYEYADSEVQSVGPIRRAVPEAVEADDGVANAGIGSREALEAVRRIDYVRYESKIVRIRVLVLTN